VQGQLEAMDSVTACEVSYDTKTAAVTVKKGTDPKTVAAGLSGKFSGKIQD